MLYPLIVIVGLDYASPAAIMALFAGVVLLRLRFDSRNSFDRVLAIAAGCVGLGLLIDPAVAVRLYPVLVNAGLAIAFAHSLFFPPSIVERIALLHRAKPDPSVARYMRRVTAAWIAFFASNGLAAAWTVRFGTLEQWALYNGVVAYVLMGGMFVGEWIVRRLVMRAKAASA
jgi:uncharacterized membrane protein